MLRLVWLLILHYFLHLFCLNNLLIPCYGFLFIQHLHFSRKLIMASSKVEIVSSASPFRCVLRDHNWRDHYNRNNIENCNNVETAFQTKIKYFVQDHHFNASISDSTPPKSPQNAGEWLVNQEKITISNETRQNGRGKREVSPNLSDDSSIETKEKSNVSDETRQNGHGKREVSPNLSEGSSIETNNTGCVSSLVQRWRGFSDTQQVTKKINNPNSPPSSTPVSNADTSTILGKSNNCDENLSSISGETICDSVREKIDTPCREKFDTSSMSIEEDTFFICESNRAVQTSSISAQSRNLEDGGETERLRVADVIRKLKLENGMEIKIKEQEKRCYSPVISSPPRFRGRQAFNDLLMQLERDRHVELDTLVERHAVSKFSHRGRIQSLLRLKFLRRDAIVRHQQQQQYSKIIGPQIHSHSTPPPAPQQPSSCEESIIVDNPEISLSVPVPIETQKPKATSKKQEKYVSKSVLEQNSDVQHSETLPSEHNLMSQGSKVVLLREKFNVLDKADPVTPKTPRGVAKNYNPIIKNISTSNQLREELHQQQEVSYSARTSCSSQDSVIKEIDEISSASCDPSRQITDYEVENTSSIISQKILTIPNKWDFSDNLEERDQNYSASLRQETKYEADNIFSPVSEKIMTVSDVWEDSKKLIGDDQNNQEPSDHQILESGEEWANNDFQFSSEWDEEDVNNLNWVNDIARPKSDWENLRQERYRDMLDSGHENDEMRRLLERRSVSSFLSSNLRDTMNQLMISRVERVPQLTVSHNEHNLEQIAISHIQTQTNNRNELEENKEERDSNFSDQVRYPSLEQPRSSQSSCPDTRPLSAVTNRSSLDMEYMYNIRAYMEQLQQEVSELRKTVNICMTFQEKMQCSIKKEVAAAVDISVGRAMQGSANNNTRTRSCCLCYETEVDSLFYRCGHMCTCFKCAHELQWSSGKCPICQAPIVDVVRAYPDGNFIVRR